MLANAITGLLQYFSATEKPLAVIVAGHNGSGKSSIWHESLADRIQIPLINADRMMMSVLPDPKAGHLPEWARVLRDEDEKWITVAREGVQSFIARATASKVSFATETVFSDWRPDGMEHRSKIDLVNELKDAGYFVLLVFVGLASVELSIARVFTRVELGGHNVPETKLRQRFPRTQMVISRALDVFDAAILVDNSRTKEEAFTLCQVRQSGIVSFDIRDTEHVTPTEIASWLDLVAPRSQH